jgi:UDP-GlcNAc:undecaprenyl-phosphate GlcNAc-1-phosphate transferase
VNFIDGLDALAGGVGLACAAGFAFVLDGDNRAMALALAGGLGGFLCFNRPPAKVYMGDGGAYVVGTTLALLLCFAWAPEERLALALGSLPLVACPVAEVGCSVLRRARTRTGVFLGDRGHGYDRLVSRGWPRNKAVGAYVGAQAVLAATAVGAVHLRPEFAGAIAAGCALLLLGASAALGFIGAGHPEATQ